MLEGKNWSFGPRWPLRHLCLGPFRSLTSLQQRWDTSPPPPLDGMMILPFYDVAQGAPRFLWSVLGIVSLSLCEICQENMSVNFHFPHALCQGIHACRRADVQAVSRRVKITTVFTFQNHCLMTLSATIASVHRSCMCGDLLPSYYGIQFRCKKCPQGEVAAKTMIEAMHPKSTGGSHRDQRGASDRSETEFCWQWTMCSEQTSTKHEWIFSPMFDDVKCFFFTFIQSMKIWELFHGLWCAGHSIWDLVRMLHK